MSSATSAPFGAVSSANQGPILIVVAYCFMVTCFVCTAVRISTVINRQRLFGLDDSYFLAALAFGVVQTVLIGEAASHGLGRHMDTLNSHQLQKFYKYLYAANIIAIPTMTCAKLSVLHLVRRLISKNSSMHRVYPVVFASIIVWLVFSVFAIAFECDSPHQIYKPDRCAGRGAVWYPIIIFNAITDALLAFLFTPVVWNLQMPQGQKLTVCSLFAIRIIVSGTAVAQLVELAPALHATDFSRAMLTPAIVGQLTMNFSIITAVIPSMHRFLSELAQPNLAIEIHGTKYELSQHASFGRSKKGSRNPFSRLGRSINLSRLTSQKDKHNYASNQSQEEGQSQSFNGKPRIVDFRPDLLDKNRAHIQHEPVNASNGLHNGKLTGTVGDNTSHTSRDGSQDMIIRQTVAWDVSHYDHNDGSDKDGDSHRQAHAM